MGEFIVIAFVTLREFVLLMVIPLATDGAEIVNERQALAPLTVTTTPEFIVTSSDEVGVAAEPATPTAVVAQIDAFQLPVATAYLAAPETLSVPRRQKAINNKTRLIDFCRAMQLGCLRLIFLGYLTQYYKFLTQIYKLAN